MNICCVIVTYKDRFELLKQVIESLRNLNINKIIVVSNNSSETSLNKLKELTQELKDKIKVIYLPENIGSAGGYLRGLQEFYNDKNNDFVWLLDDDNVPEENALKVIIEFWEALEIIDKEMNIALLSYRNDREIYNEAVLKKQPDLVVGQKNGFLGFDIKTLFTRIIINILHLRKKNNHISNDFEFGEVSAAYYGGFFFHKKLIDKIGYPNADFFTYADDTEYSSRIKKNGGKILVLLKSKINDIDNKWAKARNTFFIKLPLVNETNKFRLYYQVRNRIFFEKENWTTNNFMYQINKNIYLFLFRIMVLINKKIVNKDIIEIAIYDGLKGNLGKKENLFPD